MISLLINDLRFAIRQLLKNPGFTAVAMLSLALGIGATTAIFSVVSGVLINPYPYAKPSEIWCPQVKARDPQRNRAFYNMSEYREIAKVPAFGQIMATSPGGALLTGDFATEQVRMVRITASGFPFLGVPPVIGREIAPSDISAAGVPQPVTVLSYKMWQRLFNGSADAVGKTLRLDNEPYTVIGVMPPRFGWWTDDGCWVPLNEATFKDRAMPIVRLKPGATAAEAEQQLSAVHQSLAHASPADFPNDGFSSAMVNYLDMTVASGDMSTSLKLLFGAVALLLLIACANVANLQLARSTSRAREMAIRSAVGAGRGRLIRQLLTESVLLAMVGGALGLLFAVWITRVMVALMPSFYVPNEARIEINQQVMIFSLIISMLTGIIFGLMPAMRSSRTDLTASLRESTRGAGMSARSERTRGLLVVTEVALAIVLLVSATLTMRSFVAMQNVTLGYNPDHILTTNFPLIKDRYPNVEQRNRFTRDLIERIKTTPGVLAVSVGNGLTPIGAASFSFAIEGKAIVEQRELLTRVVSSDFLNTFSIPLKRGRMFTDTEIDAMAPVAVINESAVGLWPAGQDPIGRRVRMDVLGSKITAPVPGAAANTTPAPDPNRIVPDGAQPYVTVIGIVGNTRNDGISKEPAPEIVLPYSLIAPPNREIAVRTQGDPKAFMAALRDRVANMDKQQPIGRPGTVEEELGSQSAQAKFVMSLFGIFAAIGLCLAAAGIYSVLSYLVTERTHEIGVRMALGAGRRGILWLVVRRGLILTVIGIVIGLAGSLALNRFLASQLVGVTATDPLTFAAVAIVLTLVAVAACLIPAQRAARVDPMVALRYE